MNQYYNSQYSYWSTAELKAVVDALPPSAFGEIGRSLTHGSAALNKALADYRAAWARAGVSWQGPAADAAITSANETAVWVSQVADLSERAGQNATQMQAAVSRAKAAMPAQVVSAEYLPGHPAPSAARQMAAQQQQTQTMGAVQALAASGRDSLAAGPSATSWPTPPAGIGGPGGPVFIPRGGPGAGGSGALGQIPVGYTPPASGGGATVSVGAGRTSAQRRLASVTNPNDGSGGESSPGPGSGHNGGGMITTPVPSGSTSPAGTGSGHGSSPGGTGPTGNGPDGVGTGGAPAGAGGPQGSGQGGYAGIAGGLGAGTRLGSGGGGEHQDGERSGSWTGRGRPAGSPGAYAPGRHGKHVSGEEGEFGHAGGGPWSNSGRLGDYGASTEDRGWNSEDGSGGHYGAGSAQAERLAEARAAAAEREYLTSHQGGAEHLPFFPGGMGSRRNDDDRANSRPEWLVEVEDPFGLLSEYVAPSVIGEWDGDEEDEDR